MQSWEHILDRWGWPTLVLVAVVSAISILLRVVIWPIIQKKLEQGDRAMDRVNELLENQVLKAEAATERSNKVHEGLLREFKEAIEQNVRESKRQAELLEELLRRTPRP